MMEQWTKILTSHESGAGKSTTIHFLAGSTMVQDATIGHISPVKVTNEYLKEIKTDFLVAGVRVGRSRSSKNVMTLCDSPGFDDASGPEVDAANRLGIVQGVSKARSVKILVLSSGDFDTWMIGIDDHSECMNFIFTKMGNTTARILKANIIQAFDDLEKQKENDDTAFISLLEQIKCLGDEDIILLNPIKSDRKKILSKMSTT